MPDTCGHEPLLIAFLKTAGPTLAIVGAIVAWIGNNIVSWFSWQIGRSIRCYEAMKALSAEIASNGQIEEKYADPAAADVLIEALKADLGPYKPWTPYAAVVERNIVFENVSASLSVLPAKVSASVVGYYNLTNGLTAQIKDFNSYAFNRLSHRRQETVIRGLYQLGSEVSLAADAARKTIDLHVQRYHIIFGLLIAVGIIGLLIRVPALIGSAHRLGEIIKPAAEWASTCDMYRRSEPRSNIYP